ncbi:FkbM family methyltransferase [Marinactinospora thermotolerans]|uniref:Methyltransferase, FkbM family n=2 Tax=Marinactinospora thermotolerans TaxID=531310 RepID=A0A1T4T4J0_9ACTN|nr:FkbM family methyltransferase [Marinactinospora thermotolerans]AET51868.1 methyltransferase [Marinactinospora thermotolerans]SKA35161.1 methyltransferase, FkbM family [Marinactinospora thermotolerans DSM 45154]
MTDHRLGPEQADRLTPTWGWWEPGTVKVMKRVVEPGMVVFDVGAHVGYYTTLLAELVGADGHVHAFEPHPGNFQVLQRNTRALSNVTIVNTAVADDDRPRLLHFSGNTGRHSLFQTEFTGEGGRVHEVPVTTLSDYWERIGRPEVGLVKIDVEGAEAQVVTGARRLLDATPRIRVVTEYYPRNLRWGGGDGAAYLDLLRRSGLEYRAIQDDGSEREEIPRLDGDDYINLLCRRAARPSRG